MYPPVSGPGTYTIDYVYTDGNGCSNSATDLLTINPIPAVMFTNIPGPIYTDTPPFNLMGNVSPASGIFTGPGIMSGSSIFNPAIAGVGNHMITYTYTHPSSGCSASQIQYIIVGPGNVGVNEVFNISGIMIFPSPVTNQLNLSGINTKEIISLRIINILGQTLYTNTTLNETMTIDVSSFAQGTYIISFVNADGISIGKKFIKSK